MSFFSETTVKAVRKRHRCDGCGWPIEIGEAATRWAGVTDGDFAALVFHPDCREAEIALNRDVLNYCRDEWVGLCDIEREDVAWLQGAFPAVAARLFPPRQALQEADRD